MHHKMYIPFGIHCNAACTETHGWINKSMGEMVERKEANIVHSIRKIFATRQDIRKTKTKRVHSIFATLHLIQLELVKL